MARLITEAGIVDAIATRSEEAIRAWFRPPRSITVEDDAFPHLASIATPASGYDHALKHLLEKRKCSIHLWQRIAAKARDGTCTKAYAARMASQMALQA